MSSLLRLKVLYAVGVCKFFVRADDEKVGEEVSVILGQYMRSQHELEVVLQGPFSGP